MLSADRRLRMVLSIMLFSLFGAALVPACSGGDDDAGSVKSSGDDDDDDVGGDDDVTPPDDDADDDDDDDGDDDDDDDDDGPVVVTDASILALEPGTQAGVPGESLIFRADIYNPDGDTFNDVAVEWAVDRTDLAEVESGPLSSPAIELLNYGTVIVTATFTGMSPEGNEVVLVANALLYIQPDVLVLDTQSRVGTIDTSNGDVVQNRFEQNALDPSALGFTVAGHQLVVLVDSVDQNFYYVADMDPAAASVLLEIGLGENNAPGRIGYAGNNRIWITYPEQDVARVYDITETVELGAVYFTDGSAPTSITPDPDQGLLLVSQVFGPSGGPYEDGQITVFSMYSSLAVAQLELPCKRPVAGYLDITGSSGNFYAVCNGSGGDFPSVEVFLDFAHTTSLTLDGTVGGQARVGNILYVGNRQANEIYAVDLESGTFTRGPADPIELPSGSAVYAMHYDESKDRLFVGDNLDQVHAYDPSADDFTNVYQFSSYEIVDITSW